ncbi:serine hydrolase domain-containing protein [Pseudoduganella namucuonensis]|uniref:CubicO group peptidase, beta-lactamase class C family n=1 Tax=Pseudoduganella namucuonensis TaxID=1035707 RepID=A0A1I7KBU8_9BURK|nr:serine hydrolase domain-containing protein [Pseudoduganella namucuonensis]SFU94897.1 CubicO group peptidase, beta-lactamase class C family [Pseudoduganella namucuonensis]
MPAPALPRLRALTFALLTLSAPLAMLGANAATASAASAPTDALAASLDAALRQHFKPDAPGATVIVVRDGRTVLRQGYGLADIGTGAALEPAMSMRIGSVTKQFTAVAILMLAEQGKLKLDDDLRRYLPEYPAQPTPITLRHLLIHSSGIVNYTGRPGFVAQMELDLTPAQLIDTFKNEPLRFPPGTRFEYSNSNYFLLGAIIEKVSGMPYAKFVEQRIFIPAGMADTAYEGYERRPVKRAAGHEHQVARFEPAKPLSLTQPYASGALVSTVDDLARWSAALDSGKLLRPARLADAFTAQPLADGKPGPYGYGWFISTFQGHKTEQHGGAINGYTSSVLRVPDQKLFVAVLSNTQGGAAAPEFVAQHAAALALGKNLPYTAAELGQFTGVYRIDDQSSHVVKRTDGGPLTIQATGRPRAALAPVAQNAFLIGDSQIRVEFRRGADGKVDQATITDNGNALVHARSGDLPKPGALKLPQAALQRWVGRYEIMPGKFFEVRLQGEVLAAGPEGKGALPLLALAEDRFSAEEAGADLRFGIAQDGAAQVTVEHGGRSFTGKRLP